MHSCYKCGKPIFSQDVIGVNKKLINRGIEKFLCMKCLTTHFETTEEAIRKQIEHFRAIGCVLFPPKQ